MKTRLFSFAAALGVAVTLGGCPGDDTGEGDASVDAGPAGRAAWHTVADRLEGALLSVWGTSSRDVWAVGGALGNGGPPLVVRWDGAALARVPTTGTETYWWVHGTGPDDVWLVGERGRISHWNGTALEERPSPTTATLFGVLALAKNDAWAVGGTPDDAAAPNDVLLHWDGSAWTQETLPGTPLKVALYKVWGTSADDLWIVGDTGVIWHRIGGAWKREGEGVARGRLTTVAGCSASEVYAVGGRELLSWNGAAWTRSDTQLLSDVNGVACAPASAPQRDHGRVVVVGAGSLKLRLVDGAWQSDFGKEPLSDLHGAWADETGAFWGAGGNFIAAARPGASRAGVLARFGP